MHLEYLNKKNFFKEFFFKVYNVAAYFILIEIIRKRYYVNCQFINITFKIINYNFRKNLKIHQEVLYLSVNLKKKRRKKFNII